MNASRHLHSTGFSLIDIMLGLAIGMLGMIVMMQVLLVSDGSKRTTAGGGEAQINGAAALHHLALGIRQSGHGLTSLRLIGCNLTLRSGVTLNVLAPVTINYSAIPPGDAGSDTLLLASGNSGGSPEGDTVVLQPAANTYAVTTPMTFKVGDRIVAQFPARAQPCNLSLEAAVTRTATPPEVTVATGVPAMLNGSLFNLGPAPQFMAYAVRRGTLTVCDYLRDDCGDAGLVTQDTVWTPVASGIVNLRAQYGRDSSAPPMDGMVDLFDQTAPASTASAPGGVGLECAVSRILALRLALTARNGSPEKSDVTAAAPIWAGSTAAPIVLSNETDWQRYRYKLFETVVPLRNLVSLGAKTGC